MIVTKDGKMIRIDSGEIRQAGRSTQGVRLVRMEENDQVAAACLIPEAEEKADDDQADLTLAVDLSAGSTRRRQPPAVR